MKGKRKSRRSPEQIARMLRAHLPRLRQSYGVRSLGIFGSYVRGEQGPASDLDLLVELDPEAITLLGFVALERELSELLGIPVDLVEKETLKPAIGRHILAEVVAI